MSVLSFDRTHLSSISSLVTVGQARLVDREVHQHIAAGVPDLVGKVAHGLALFNVEAHVVAGRVAGDAALKRSASAPYWSMISSGSMPLPSDLDILRPWLVAHDAVDAARCRTALAGVLQAGEDHAGDPEADDVVAGHERVGRVEIPVGRIAFLSGQPSVLNGHSAEENQVSSVSGSCVRFVPPHFSGRLGAGPRLATVISPQSSQYQAGIWWPHHS
jgi:hypothetical protein